jgi:hypothetical protein
MNSRRPNRPPPESAEHIVGEPFEFSPDDDRVNAGKPLPPPVELTPTGSVAPLVEFKPADDRTAEPEPREADDEPLPPA